MKRWGETNDQFEFHRLSRQPRETDRRARHYRRGTRVLVASLVCLAVALVAALWWAVA